MSIVTTAEKVGATTVRYTWSGTAPYDVWLNGEKVLSQTDATSFVAQSPGEDVPYAIEVTDATLVGVAESERYSPRLRIQWRGQTDAAYYAIQRYSGSAWETKQIARESGQGYYRYITTAEADGASAQWRVVAEDEDGNEGAVLSHTQTVVCNPSPPNVAGTYAAGTGLLTIAAG